ncbi:MAG: hypothetical protein RIB84_20865 [Sneathiellaceae bacterium]
MRPALVLIAAAIALFLFVKGAPYLLVRAEALATSIVFSQAWDHARGGLDALGPAVAPVTAVAGAGQRKPAVGMPEAAASEPPPERSDWRLTAARPVARLTAPRLRSDAVIVSSERRGNRGMMDFLLVAPSLSSHRDLIPPPDAVKAADGGASRRVGAAGSGASGVAAAGSIHAHGVTDTVIVDSAGRSLRFLPDLRPGDELELEGVDGQIYRYRVSGSRVALSLQADELENPDLVDGHPELTLVAPYPLNDLTPSAFRYVVRADFVDLGDR